MLAAASWPVQVWAQAPPQVQVSDLLKKLQTRYAASASEKEPRVFHFGSQGAGSVFSNHTSHTNRLVGGLRLRAQGRPWLRDGREQPVS